MRARALAAAAGAALVAASAASAPAWSAPRATLSFGTMVRGTDVLVVTFADTPSASVARNRLDGLGRVSAIAPGAGVWRLRPSGDGPAARRVALRRPGVRAVEWPLSSRTQAREPEVPPLSPIAPATPITDPLRPQQWWLNTDGWSDDLIGREPRPIIAVLDSGLDMTHPEWSGANAAAIVGARTMIPNRNPIAAGDWGRTGHGTHVMGIAAAPADGVGVVGVAPATAQSQVMPVQVADRYGEFRDDDVMAGIRWAVDNGAKVINISAGGTGHLVAFQRTIFWATRRGALIVAAVGNEGDVDNPLLYPAAYRRVLGVGAQCGPRRSVDCPAPYGPAVFSQRNASVDVIAPGIDMLSTVPSPLTDAGLPDGYAYRDGTSMAAPYVAGVAALVQAAHGNRLTPYQVMRQIERTADDRGPRGRDNRSGWGSVNVARAVTTPAPADDPSEVNDDIGYVRWLSRLSQDDGPVTVQADLDRFDDPSDVQPVRVRKGQRVRVVATNSAGRLGLAIWGPRTRTVQVSRANVRRNRLGYVGKPGRRQVLVVRARRTGLVYVEAKALKGTMAYRMRITTRR
ncbi:MAG: S8 family serine peptidase [Thermoleophilia bacterium]